ncbi:MAG: TIGR03560 family F420-dependent LLM class oxidoreductase [Actinomycetota bacterium]
MPDPAELRDPASSASIPAMLVSAKLAPVFEYERLVEFWTAADELGYHAVWNYDHFYGLGQSNTDLAAPTLEAWTTLAAMAVLVKRARIGCMVTGVTYRHPAVLAKMAVTVDHISAGRLEFGIGAAWHQPEHEGLGIEFPPPGARVDMLDEALTLIKTYWTQDRPSFEGRRFRLHQAICEPKPVQRPHPPIVVGAAQPRMLRLVAEHADEWNVPGADAETFARLSKQIDENCGAIGRDPGTIRRGVQLFIHPAVEGQADEQFQKFPEFEAAGCQHVVLSFYQPPPRDMLERLAPR